MRKCPPARRRIRCDATGGGNDFLDPKGAKGNYGEDWLLDEDVDFVPKKKSKSLDNPKDEPARESTGRLTRSKAGLVKKFVPEDLSYLNRLKLKEYVAELLELLPREIVKAILSYFRLEDLCDAIRLNPCYRAVIVKEICRRALTVFSIDRHTGELSYPFVYDHCSCGDHGGYVSDIHTLRNGHYNPLNKIRQWGVDTGKLTNRTIEHEALVNVCFELADLKGEELFFCKLFWLCVRLRIDRTSEIPKEWFESLGNIPADIPHIRETLTMALLDSVAIDFAPSAQLMRAIIGFLKPRMFDVIEEEERVKGTDTTSLYRYAVMPNDVPGRDSHKLLLVESTRSAQGLTTVLSNLYFTFELAKLGVIKLDLPPADQ